MCQAGPECVDVVTYGLAAVENVTADRDCASRQDDESDAQSEPAPGIRLRGAESFEKVLRIKVGRRSLTSSGPICP